MIPGGVEVWVSVEPVDLRWGFERLGGAVRERCGRDPRCRALFVFFGRHRQTAKILYYDGTGLCLWSKRLDRGRFRVALTAAANATSVRLNDASLEMLLGDIDVDPAGNRRRIH